MHKALAYLLSKRVPLRLYTVRRYVTTWDEENTTDRSYYSSVPMDGDPNTLGSDDLKTIDQNVNGSVRFPHDVAKVHVLQPTLFQYGDYNNTNTLERSNMEAFLADHEGMPGLFEMTGAFYWNGLGIYLPDLPDVSPDDDEDAEDFDDSDEAWAVRSMLEALDLGDYPVYDEDHMSTLETTLHDESFDDWIGNDLATAIAKHLGLDEVDPSDPADDAERPFLQAYYALYWAALEEANEYPIYEDPTSAYVDVARVAKVVTLDMLDAAGIPYTTEDED
jgi:hypothetical protein